MFIAIHFVRVESLSLLLVNIDIHQPHFMFGFVITFSILIFNDALLVDKWKEMDKDICYVLNVTNRDKWDGMLKTVETYIEEINNLTAQIIPQNVGELWPELVPILKNGRPRFITVPVFGPTLKREYNMTDWQIYQVWVLRNQADQGYDRFIQRMTWMKDNHVLDVLKNNTRPG